MTANVGLVVVDVTGGCDIEGMKSLVAKGMQEVPEGRILALQFDMPVSWREGKPYEGEFVSFVLGSPDQRRDGFGWEFFGSVYVRLCAVTPNDRKISSEQGLVLVRRLGPKVYQRRHELDKKFLENSTIETLHPVFTRDVANNVWHLPSKLGAKLARNRLFALVAWPDEEMVLLRPKSTRRFKNQNIDFRDSLIGVPTKNNYTFENE